MSSRSEPPYDPVDCEGRPIAAGDRVRIVGLPDFGSLHPDGRDEVEAVFRHLLGRTKKVTAITELGLLELDFRIRDGEHRGRHWAWIEPFLVRVIASLELPDDA